jgi:uncharacterized membrane protein YgdD (TMEM256/DUF423 family)
LKKERQILATAAMLAAIAVLAGAFGAHGLKKLVPTESVNSFQTAARYLLMHAVAMMAIAAMPSDMLSPRRKKILFVILVLGVLLFSGSIFLLVLNHIWQLDILRIMGPITPVGGLFLISSWLFLFWTVISGKR